MPAVFDLGDLRVRKPAATCPTVLAGVGLIIVENRGHVEDGRDKKNGTGAGNVDWNCLAPKNKRAR